MTIDDSLFVWIVASACAVEAIRVISTLIMRFRLRGTDTYNDADDDRRATSPDKGVRHR